MVNAQWRTLVVVATMALVAAACSQNAGSRGGRDPHELVFAVVPDEESTSLYQAFQPVMDLLRKETGKPVRFQQATDYAAVIEGQRNGKVDIAKYGALSYLVARAAGVTATAVAAAFKEKGRPPGYRSYGIVKRGSAIHDLAAFKDKRICFVDPNSTSGYLYPRAGLIAAGINPDKDITSVMAGGHDASVLGVMNGQCDAGFAFDDMVDSQLVKKGELKAGELVTVWTSDVIPGPPVAVRDDLTPELTSKIVKVFQEQANLDYMRSAGLCAGAACMVDNASSWGYAKVDDAFYDSVRQVCQAIGSQRCAQAS